MDKYYSYTDFLRAVGHFPKVEDSERLLNDIYLDLFLNRLLRLQRISQLEQLIDLSLDERNERLFKTYTEELKSLLEESAL